MRDFELLKAIRILKKIEKNEILKLLKENENPYPNENSEKYHIKKIFKTIEYKIYSDKYETFEQFINDIMNGLECAKEAYKNYSFGESLFDYVIKKSKETFDVSTSDLELYQKLKLCRKNLSEQSKKLEELYEKNKGQYAQILSGLYEKEKDDDFILNANDSLYNENIRIKNEERIVTKLLEEQKLKNTVSARQMDLNYSKIELRTKTYRNSMKFQEKLIDRKEQMALASRELHEKTVTPPKSPAPSIAPLPTFWS